MTEQIFIGSVFAAGVLSFFSPCILPLLPVYIAQLGGAAQVEPGMAVTLGRLRLQPALVANTLFFVLGVSFVFVLLGFGAGALGSVINAPWFMRVCGLLVIGFGMIQTGLIRLPSLQRERRFDVNWNGKKGLAASLLLGFVFSFGWTPCIGPVLTAILSLSAGEGSSLRGGGYMLVYALGLAVPFLVLSLCSGFALGFLKGLNRHAAALKVVSGLLLIAMGVLLMTNDLNNVIVWF